MSARIDQRNVTRKMGSQNMKRALLRITGELTALVGLAPQPGPHHEREVKIIQGEIRTLATRIVKLWDVS